MCVRHYVIHTFLSLLSFFPKQSGNNSGENENGLESFGDNKVAFAPQYTPSGQVKRPVTVLADARCWVLTKMCMLYNYDLNLQ